MELEIYNESLESVGIIDTPPSLIWHRKFFKAGVFEIYAPVNENNVELLKVDNIVTKEDSTEFGIIDTLHIIQGEDGEHITASGCFGSALLNRRIIWEQTRLTMAAELAMRQLVADNLISPVITQRAMPRLILGNLQGFEETVDCNVQGKLVGDYISKLSKVSNIGMRLIFDKVNKKLIFECYKGTDRSIEQTENPQIVFSQEYDNLRSCDYLCSNVGKVNAVKAQYSPSIYAVSDNDVSGLDRYESYVEETQAVTVPALDGEGKTYDKLDIPATLEVLTDKAKQAIVPASENFEGSVDFSQGYKTDYDLGDIVTIFKDEWGASISTRIYEIQEVYDENGTQIIPIFGSPLKSLADILKEA